MLNSIFQLLVACMPVMQYVLPFFGFFIICFVILLFWRLLDV